MRIIAVLTIAGRGGAPAATFATCPLADFPGIVPPSWSLPWPEFRNEAPPTARRAPSTPLLDERYAPVHCVDHWRAQCELDTSCTRVHRSPEIVRGRPWTVKAGVCTAAPVRAARGTRGSPSP